MGLVKRLVILSMLLALLGCDNNKQNSVSTSNETQPTTELKENVDNVNQNSHSPKTFTSTPELVEKYRNKQLTVIDSSEVILDGSSTLVITFSVPLNPQLNFSNLLRLVDQEKGKVDGAWELSDNGLELRHRFLEPNRKLSLTIDKMLAAINDSHLKSVYQAEFTTRDRQPLVGFASNGFLLPSKSMTGLPVITLNVDKIDVNFFKIRPEKLPEFMENFGLINRFTSWHSQDLNKYADLVYSSRFDLNPKRNAQESVLINLSKIEELQKEGVYIAVMNRAGSYDFSNPATLFSISNIGISVHVYENRKLEVITHALDNGQPLADIRLSMQCNNSRRDSKEKCLPIVVQSDKQGYAEITLPDEIDYSLLTASDGQQTSFVDLKHNALDLREFNRSGNAFYQKQLFAFGARDLYRPQETVYFNALLRNADGKLLPEQPIIVDVIAPDEQVVRNLTVDAKPNSHGLYQWQFVIPSDAATGKWTFRFNLGDDNYRYANFQVEDFLPERIAMEINTTSSKPIVTGKSVDFDVKAWYLYGAPASGNSLEGNLYLKKIDSIAELAGYKIGAITDNMTDQHLDSIEQSLDNNGVAHVNVESSNWSDLRSPVKVVFQASLLDSGGRPVTRYASQTIWPANQMPAIQALFAESPYYDWSTDRYENRPTIDKGSIAEFEVAYIDFDGQKQATNDLKARIVRERRNYYWSWSDSDGWQQQYNSSEFIVSEEQLSIAENSTTKVSYQPDDYGSYRLEVVDTKNNIMSSVRFWSGYSWEDNTNGSNSVRPDQVKLSIDKTSYAVGDTAKVHIQAPVAGSGYISLETNDGMLWKQNIAVVDEKGLDVEIPIEDWGRHDIYINAMIIRPSTDAAVQTVKRAIGLLYLPIDTSHRQLNVVIDAPKKTEPEKTIPIKIKLDKDQVQTDQKVTILVSAVDSGVLNITRFATPDPYSAFLGRKSYNVDLYDVYGKLIEGTGRTVNMSFGGDAMLSQSAPGGKKPMTEVNIVAQQLATIELNEEGEGSIDLPLPNFNGELRIMAQAWDDDRFGKAEQTMIVAAPVVAELSIPRFLSGGDHAVLALDINNLTEKNQTMQIDITTTGLLHQEKPQSTTLTFNSQQRRIISVPVITDYGYGQGGVTVNVKGITLEDGSDYQINRTWKIGVRPAYAATNKNYAVAINGGESWTFSEPIVNELIDNTVDGKLIISNQPPLNIAQYIKSLFAYPYGCLEQTISGLYPSLYVNQEQLVALGIKTDTDEKRREQVQLGIARILSMQRTNGSFGLWNRESSEEHWLSVYATEFLLQAKERGYQVSDTALNSAMTRIGQYIYDANTFNNLQSYDSSVNTDYIQFATKAYALMVLAKQNKITPAMRNEINRMSEQVKTDNSIKLSPLPIAQLALSAKLVGFENIYNQLTPEVFTTNYDSKNYWLGDYGSSVRDKALILSLLIENDLNTDRQADYLFNLSELLNDKRYFSTQELNALFRAGWLLEQRKASSSFKVQINEQLNEINQTLTRSFSYDDLEKGLTVTNPENAEPLYLKFSISGYSKKSPAPTASDNVLTISRSYYNLKGEALRPEKLQVGDLMVVVVEVMAKQAIHDALIVDFVPAGFELENQNLLDSSVNLTEIPELVNILKYENSNDIKYQEYRDDRYVAAVDIHNYILPNKYRKRVAYLVRAVTAGDYTNPYPYVESMYHPEWFAVGGSLDLISIIQRNWSN